MSNKLHDSITGCILGTAVGDAIGLPAEGLLKKRLNRMYPNLDGYHLVFGRGMISDDTEHTCMVAQALIASAGDVDIFRCTLARQLKSWLLMLPAGTGLATAKSIIRLLVGFHPERSGVYSAGNGPAMRSAIIGVCYGNDTSKMQQLVRASTRITHTDPKAEYGALAVALAAHHSADAESISPRGFHQELSNVLGNDAEELLKLVEKAIISVEECKTTSSFAEEIGCNNGVSGYIYNTLPIVIHAWLSHPDDLKSAVLDVVRCGGDTDTTAAIVGGIVGARVGLDGIPSEWLSGLFEWPRSVKWMILLSNRLTHVVEEGKTANLLPLPRIPTITRNILFLIIVLLHGFRRLLPPY